MNLKTYRAATTADAVAQIKKDLGPGAVILHTRQYKSGGLLGFRAKRMVEITASSNVNVLHPLARKGKAPSEGPALRPNREALRQAYSVAPSAVSAACGSGSGDSGVAAGGAGAAVADAGPRSWPMEQVGAVSTESNSARELARGIVSPAGDRSPAGASGLWDEIATIKRLVGQVLQSSHGKGQPAMPEALFQRYLRLIEAEVVTELADEIVGAVRDELNADELADDAIVHQAVLRRLACHIPVCCDAPKAGKTADARPLTIALVGPTGVGKTTTIAKLAATYKLRHGKSVGIVTCDTYRIAAVEQLRTYANIIGMPLKVALTPKEMAGSCASLADCEVVLIDTAGRSQHDSARLGDLAAFLAAARPHETHLVLSGAASQSVMKRTAECFSVVQPNRVILTKLDEVVNFGVLVNAARSIGSRLSFVTTGQEVPDHIEPGRADRLARLVLEGGGVR